MLVLFNFLLGVINIEGFQAQSPIAFKIFNSSYTPIVTTD
jgi:hypothetical protein